MTLAEWLEKYDRAKEEGPERVIAKCYGADAGYCDKWLCEGWVLTYRDAIYPHETLLTPEERAEAGLPPDEWTHLNRGVYDD